MELRKAQAAADLTALLAGTGVRIEEARSIRWRHLDLEHGALFVDGTKSKTAERNINLPSGSGCGWSAAAPRPLRLLTRREPRRGCPTGSCSPRRLGRIL